MLPSSASTTSNLAVTGVSGTVENRPARQVKLRNTRSPVGAENRVTVSDQRVYGRPTSAAPSTGSPA
jgi:hypothetical protein